MRVIASYILKGPLQAILAATVPAILSVSAPLLLKMLLVYFSGIALALVSLRLGAKKGLAVLLVVTIATLATGQVLELDFYARLDLWNTVYMWALVWLAASIWYSSRSLPLMLEVTGLISILTVMIYFVAVDNPYQAGLDFLQPISQALNQPEAGLSSEELTRINAMLQWVATMLAGSIVAYTALGAIITLFVARSWQAKLFNPGGWQQEFRALRLGRHTGIITIALIVGMVFSRHLGESTGLILINISVIIGLIYVIVGLGIAHALLALKDSSGFWLVGLYALLILLSQLVAPLLMALALTDIWVDYRARFAKKLS